MTWLLPIAAMLLYAAMLLTCRHGATIRHPRSAFFWCCCGPAPCEIHIDPFTRANSTDLGADWTEVAGDWSIASNRLSVSAADAIVTSDPVAENVFTNIRVRITLQVDGSAGRVIFDYDDSSNFYFAEIKAGAASGATLGHFKVVQKAAGIDTELFTKTMFIDDISEHQINVCYDQDDKLLVSLTAGGGPNAGCEITGHVRTSTTVGLGTGTWNGASPAILFDTFEHKHRQAGCVDCPYVDCGGCSEDPHNMPNEMQIDVTGIANQTCLNCASLNATYIVKPVGIVTGPVCRWDHSLAATICNVTSVRLDIQSVGGNWRLAAIFRSATGTDYQAHNDQVAQYACESLSLQSLGTLTDSSSQCDFSGASVTVSTA